MKKVLIPLAILLLITGCSEEKITEPDYGCALEIPSFRYSDNCFYLAQPELMYEIYSEDDIIELDLPEGWANNAIKLDDEGHWIFDNEYYTSLPDLSTLRVFIDDGATYNNYSAIEGYEIGVQDTVYYFDECTIGVDVNIENYILLFQYAIQNEYTIGVTYIQNDGLQIGEPDSSSIEIKLLKKPYQSFIDNPEYWELQARNIYQYGNVYLDGSARVIIGYKNNHTGSLITSIPDSIDTGSYINTVTDYLRLDINEDSIINPEDAIFEANNFLIRLPLIYPFKSLDSMNIYQNDQIENVDWNYYIRIEDPDN